MGLGPCLVWFSVPIRGNGRIFIPAPHSVPSALFIVCFVFAVSNCRCITNTKGKENIYFIMEKKKLKLLALQCLIENTMLHLNNFSKGGGDFKVDLWQWEQ